jgi:NhaP-type Na+/H+ or K+/H+ antiporter/outer membrane protein OmpA-like peptidoglycan-associated protein
MQEQAIVIAFIGVLGIGAQWLAWRTNRPAIVLMLGAGFIAGPVLGIFDPEHAFGELLEPMIAIGVALVLFEGGLSLNFRELRDTSAAVGRMATIGVALGWLFGALAAYAIAGLLWPVAVLFGGILIVTGPTVVVPLLRQATVQARPASLLKWEAIVNDPTGAMCAVIAYEYFRLSGTGATWMEIIPPMLLAAVLAAVLGYLAARFVAWSYPRGLVPEYLKVPVLFVTVIALFVISNAIENEAGLVAVTVMGIALANMNVQSLRSIHPFKETVAILLVSGIFILLSASLKWSDLAYLNWRFGLFLLVLLFVVRPATVLLTLLGSSIPWNERLFVAWIAPRGIVLVAISGLFALRLTELGYADGNVLIGLSFAVVVATVLAHGFTIDLAAKLFGVKGETRPGLLLVGSTPWTIALAEMMQELKTPVMVVDSSWQRLTPARRKNLPYYHGEILNEATEHNLDLSPYQALVAATENEAYNTLVCSEFAHEIGRDAVYQIGQQGDDDDRQSMPEALRGRALFESGYGIDDIAERLAQGWQLRKTKLSDSFKFEDAKDVLPPSANLLMLLKGDGRMQFFTHAARPNPGPGDTVISFAPAKDRTGSKREKAAAKAGKALPAIMAFMALVGCNGDRNDKDAPAPAPATEAPAPAPTSIMRADIVTPDPAPAMLAPLEATIRFDDGSTELSEAATEKLQAMLGSPQFEAGAAITIGAHTDSAGSDSVNLAVSRKRGMQVRDWFVEHGVAADRITLVAFGEQNPIEPNALPDGSPNEIGRKANRRVEVRMVVSTDLSPIRREPTLAEDLVNQLNGDASPPPAGEAAPGRAR